MKTVYSNPWFRVECEGTMHRVVNNAPFGVILVVEDERGLLLAGRHDRFATQSEGGLELPRGNAKPGETPGDAATRELREETGIEADAADMKDIGVIHADSGLVSDEAHVMVLEASAPRTLADGHDDEFSSLTWMAPEGITSLSSDALTIAAIAKNSVRDRTGHGHAPREGHFRLPGGVEYGERRTYEDVAGRSHEYIVARAEEDGSASSLRWAEAPSERSREPRVGWGVDCDESVDAILSSMTQDVESGGMTPRSTVHAGRR